MKQTNNNLRDVIITFGNSIRIQHNIEIINTVKFSSKGKGTRTYIFCLLNIRKRNLQRKGYSGISKYK